jgi:hypothetical protein
MLGQLGRGGPHPRGVITCESAAEAAEGGTLQRQAVAVAVGAPTSAARCVPRRRTVKRLRKHDTRTTSFTLAGLVSRSSSADRRPRCSRPQSLAQSGTSPEAGEVLHVPLRASWAEVSDAQI